MLNLTNNRYTQIYVYAIFLCHFFGPRILYLCRILPPFLSRFSAHLLIFVYDWSHWHFCSISVSYLHVNSFWYVIHFSFATRLSLVNQNMALMVNHFQNISGALKHQKISKHVINICQYSYFLPTTRAVAVHLRRAWLSVVNNNPTQHWRARDNQFRRALRR